MQKSFLFVVAVFISLTLSGCGSTSGGGASPLIGTSSLSTEDLAGIEAALLADRVDQAIALETSPELAASIQADVTSTGSFQRRGRSYSWEKSSTGRHIRRGAGTFPIDVAITSEGGQLNIGGETCTVSRLEDGTLKLVRGNGSEILIGSIPEAGGSAVLDVAGVPWNAVFGTGDEALVTLTNTRSGRVLIINESDTGELTVVADGDSTFRGRWNQDGEVECTGDSGRQYRYRGGR